MLFIVICKVTVCGAPVSQADSANTTSIQACLDIHCCIPNVKRLTAQRMVSLLLVPLILQQAFGTAFVK